MRRYNVECVCTTDDPIDDLRYHKQTRESGFEIKMIPAWRLTRLWLLTIQRILLSM